VTADVALRYQSDSSAVIKDAHYNYSISFTGQKLAARETIIRRIWLATHGALQITCVFDWSIDRSIWWWEHFHSAVKSWLRVRWTVRVVAMQRQSRHGWLASCDTAVSSAQTGSPSDSHNRLTVVDQRDRSSVFYPCDNVPCLMLIRWTVLFLPVDLVLWRSSPDVLVFLWRSHGRGSCLCPCL